MRNTALLSSFVALFLTTALLVPSVTQAETVGSTISVPITFTASDAVTAADFTVSVTNGQLQEISCGGSGFSSLSSNGSQCVVFNPSGATSGTLATVTVLANTAGTLTVSAVGTLSTAGGVAPTTGQINGSTYTITGSGGATATSTPAPSASTSRTPTPTAIGALPSSGAVDATLIYSLIIASLLGSGFWLFRKL
ncbi:hypothetical protein HGA91_04695 [candidate division WWE3 bacterium]|nr:hypothetical protein [candidate division WWE3 bacterium]